MTRILIKTETEKNNGWDFEVEVQDADVHHHHVSLNWSDYDLWSRGKVAPEKVVKAVFRFLLEREPAETIFKRFDCAVVRRYFPEVDKTLPGMI